MSTKSGGGPFDSAAPSRRKLTHRGSDSFSWDYEDRMVSATVNAVTTSFAYRGDGLRDSRTVGMATTTFTWDIAAGLPVVLDDGAQYLYGPSGLVTQKQGGSKYYYLADGLGSVMKTTDASGNVVNSYTYDVYGKKTSQSGGQVNEFDFAGQQTDASTGLQYPRARYMDMDTGTFMSRDPLAAGPGFTGSGFGYAGAGPVNASDPSGLEIETRYDDAGSYLYDTDTSSRWDDAVEGWVDPNGWVYKNGQWNAPAAQEQPVPVPATFEEWPRPQNGECSQTCNYAGFGTTFECENSSGYDWVEVRPSGDSVNDKILRVGKERAVSAAKTCLVDGLAFGGAVLVASMFAPDFLGDLARIGSFPAAAGGCIEGALRGAAGLATNE